MATVFEKAHAFTMQWEGGYVDHPSDPGGATQFGISLRFLREQGLDLDGDGDIDADDVRTLSKEQAEELYKKHFWTKAGCPRLPKALALVCYDTAVNLGPPKAVRLLQSSCNTVAEANLPEYSPIVEDGLAGKKTAELAEMLHHYELAFFTARHLLRARARFYRELAARRPAMQVFLKGWLARVEALNQLLAAEERN